jgi:hypothetical protein
LFSFVCRLLSTLLVLLVGFDEMPQNVSVDDPNWLFCIFSLCKLDAAGRYCFMNSNSLARLTNSF